MYNWNSSIARKWPDNIISAINIVKLFIKIFIYTVLNPGVD